MTDLPDGVTICDVSDEKIDFFWERIKKFDRLFSDERYWDRKEFSDWLKSDYTAILECRDGIMILDDVVKGLKGSIHAAFWDCRLRGKEEMLRGCLIWAINRFNLYRLEAKIPDFSIYLRKFLEERLGFKFEGIERHSLRFEGRLINRIRLSLLREEVING